jgi:hypothetical protein
MQNLNRFGNKQFVGGLFASAQSSDNVKPKWLWHGVPAAPLALLLLNSGKTRNPHLSFRAAFWREIFLNLANFEPENDLRDFSLWSK